MTTILCSITNCPNPSKTKGFCSKHYNRIQRHGNPYTVKRDTNPPRVCTEIGCNEPFFVLKRCSKHAERYRLLSNPLCKVNGCMNHSKSKFMPLCNTHYRHEKNGISKERLEKYHSRFIPRSAIIEGDIAKIPLGIDAKDGYTIVDANYSNLDEHKWFKSDSGYAKARIDKKIVLIHRLILGITKETEYADHINGDRLDNRRSNLRIVTHRQNMMNVRPRSANGYKGVSHSPSTKNKWRAYINPNRKQINLGYYATPEEAAKAYDEAAIKYFGEYAYLNFPS